MLFSEVYSAYFNAVAAVITEVLTGNLAIKDVGRIIGDKAFSESILTIPPALMSGEWLVMDKGLQTPIKRKPQMPLTILQKRWLKTLTQDPRLALFGADLSGLEGLEPLFKPEDFVFFDRYADGDPYTDTAYIGHFRAVLTALNEKRRIHIAYRNRYNRLINSIYIPYRLEYSSKDDKFRLETAGGKHAAYINLQRIASCEVLEAYAESDLLPPKRRESVVTFLLTDERNALNRVMLHFSDCRKETIRLEGNRYQVRLWFEAQDETEILIRVIFFGPMLKVIAPDDFITKVKNRLTMQRAMMDQASED